MCKTVCFPPFSTKNNSVSLQLHAVCLDTTPPCVYMNDVSHSAQDLVHAINQRAGKKVVNCGNYDFSLSFPALSFYINFQKVCYTFDAGPNACLFLLEENLAMVAKCIYYLFVPLKMCTFLFFFQNQVASSVLRFFPPAHGQDASSYLRGPRIDVPEAQVIF